MKKYLVCFGQLYRDTDQNDLKEFILKNKHILSDTKDFPLLRALSFESFPLVLCNADGSHLELVPCTDKDKI